MYNERCLYQCIILISISYNKPRNTCHVFEFEIPANAIAQCPHSVARTCSQLLYCCLFTVYETAWISIIPVCWNTVLPTPSKRNYTSQKTYIIYFITFGGICGSLFPGVCLHIFYFSFVKVTLYIKQHDSYSNQKIGNYCSIYVFYCWDFCFICRQFKHPNIVKYYGTALFKQGGDKHPDKRLYMVMEFCQTNLARILFKRPEITPGKQTPGKP